MRPRNRRERFPQLPKKPSGWRRAGWRRGFLGSGSWKVGRAATPGRWAGGGGGVVVFTRHAKRLDGAGFFRMRGLLAERKKQREKLGSPLMTNFPRFLGVQLTASKVDTGELIIFNPTPVLERVRFNPVPDSLPSLGAPVDTPAAQRWSPRRRQSPAYVSCS